MMIAILICNALVDLGIVAASTLAAFHFEDPRMMCWCLLILVTGWSIKTKEKKDDDEETA